MSLQELLIQGLQLHQADQYPQAEAVLGQVVRTDPSNTDAWVLLAETCLLQGKFAEADAAYRCALRLRPLRAFDYVNHGVALLKRGLWDEAVASLRYAQNLEPRDFNVLNTLGVALKDQGNLDESVACLLQATRLAPGFADAFNNLGVALMSLGRHDEAGRSLQEALRLRPDFAEGHKTLGMVLLQQGDYANGWREYEWRLACPDCAPPSFDQPRWDGGPLQGRTILLYPEQGLGDTLQFIRYAPLLKERGGRVVVLCQANLIPLLFRCPGIDELVPYGTLPRFDVHSSLVSLPGLFGTTLDTVPAQVPYLFPDAALVAQWGRDLGARTGIRVGIVWQGRLTHPNDRERSTRLVFFAPLARLPGVHLISLQKEPGSEQLGEVTEQFAVIDLGSQLDETSGAFMDTAAVMQCLDLVITVDTSAAHLAGALGVPVWVAQACAPDWRWQWDAESTPWYPTMRFFRQAERGKWEAAFERIAAALQARLAQPSGRHRGSDE